MLLTESNKLEKEESKDKFYNIGFTDAENSKEPIMVEAWRYRFGEGWAAVVNALGLPKDSAFKNLEQIPYPEELIHPPAQTIE